MLNQLPDGGPYLTISFTRVRCLSVSFVATTQFILSSLHVRVNILSVRIAFKQPSFSMIEFKSYSRCLLAKFFFYNNLIRAC